jgi:HAD superfamily hydrolase (TIGR01509 family)
VKQRVDVRAVLFDLDGTLTKFNIDYQTARQEINKELETYGLGELPLREGVFITSMLNHVQTHMPAETYRRFLRRVHRLIEKYEVVSAQTADLQPDVISTLKRLKKSGVKTAIVTNNCQTATRTVIDRFGLHDLIDELVSREDAPLWKPDGAMVRETLHRLQVRPMEALFVGDSTIDVLAARDSGVASVALFTGPTKASRLLAEAPDYLLGSLAELPTLITTLI